MAGEISNVTRPVPNTINETLTFEKGAVAAAAADVIKDVAAIISSRSVNVVNALSTPEQPGQPNGATGVPALDNPADLKQLEEDLEKLLAYLQLDNEERQAEMAKERIAVQKDSIKAEHEDRKEKINDSLKKMDDAAKSRLANRIFGWIGAIVAVAMAVAAVAFTIVTGGAGAVAAGFAIAGAVVAVTSLVMSETGATDKLIKAIADSLEKSGMSKSGAQIAAALIVNLSIMAVSLGCSIGGMVAGLAQVGKAVVDMTAMAVRVAKLAQTATSIASTAVGVGALAAGTAATATGYKSDMAKADLSELEKIMTELQRRLDESEEELNAILEAIQNGLGQIAALLDSATDTQTEIAGNIGQMA